VQDEAVEVRAPGPREPGIGHGNGVRSQLHGVVFQTHVHLRLPALCERVQNDPPGFAGIRFEGSEEVEPCLSAGFGQLEGVGDLHMPTPVELRTIKLLFEDHGSEKPWDIILLRLCWQGPLPAIGAAGIVGQGFPMLQIRGALQARLSPREILDSD
jgi:hypothetical protein